MTEMQQSHLPTSLENEILEQKKWCLRPQQAEMTVFNTLLYNEFMSSDERQKKQWQILQRLLQFCNGQVPYYRKLFKDQGLDISSMASPTDLQKIPILTRFSVQENEKQHRPEKLPQGVKICWTTKTSGTTGQPVKIVHTKRSGLFFGFLKQREFRWFRWDPRHVMAAIRSAGDLPPAPSGKPITHGQTCHINAWQRVGTYFDTAPFYGFMWTNPVEEQIKWLSEIQPAYLVAQASDLEQLALAYQEKTTPVSLMGILSIAQEMNEEMHERIEGTFRVPVHLNYGLNEIGLVASRCPEGGRYHVHTEHCFVEIVDEQGRHCKPGQRGRILVTALNNLAMPLLRYDTDDLAEAIEGPCPCGRSLPSFGRIHGRYRRLTSLPPGTMNFFSAVEQGLSSMPEEASAFLRQFQLHQFKDGSFELRVVVSAQLPPLFHEKIMEKWQQVDATALVKLAITEVDHIFRSPGGKFQKFTSDFMPVPAFR